MTTPPTTPRPERVATVDREDLAIASVAMTFMAESARGLGMVSHAERWHEVARRLQDTLARTRPADD